MLPLVLAIAATTAGCAVVGPNSLRNGRSAYREAINNTNEQQTLETIVRLRYAETSSLLAVSSVTANIRFAGEAGIEAGFGPSDNYIGNLVPLSAGVAYEENPVISYTPVDGARFMRELLSPIPLDLYLLILDTGEPELVFPMLTESMNGIRNPRLFADLREDEAERFERLVELSAELDVAGCFDWGKTDGEDTFAAILHGYEQQYLEQTQALLDVLGLEIEADGGIITIPIYLGVASPHADGIAVTTRSLYQIIRRAAEDIDVPEEHVANMLALDLPTTAPGRALLRIRSSAKPPATAVVAIPYRDHWFYIDASDRSSRMSFLILQSLATVRLSDIAGDGQRSPVLTVPVSR
jgi:hypothetical protein